MRLYSFIFILLSLNCIGQGFRYQATLKGTDGNLIVNSSLNVMVKLRSGIEGDVSFSEIHEVDTDNLGRIDFIIGEGGFQSSLFKELDWSDMNKFLEILIDENRDGDFESIGIVKLQAVPYSLFSISSSNGLSDGKQVIKGKKTFLEPINGVFSGGVILNDDVPAVAGAIKWNGSDFIGFDGDKWVSLSSGGGNEIETFNCGDNYIDPRDGNEYRTALFGLDCWMIDNLRLMTDEGSYTGIGDYSISNAGVYYTWSGAMAIPSQYNSTIYSDPSNEPRGVCPEGWHVSTHDEWLLLDELTDIDGITLQEGGTSGFGAKLVGDRLQDGTFSNSGISAVFWTSTEMDAKNAYKRILFDGEEGVGVFVFEKDYGFCVRCVKN